MKIHFIIIFLGFWKGVVAYCCLPPVNFWSVLGEYYYTIICSSRNEASSLMPV